MGDESTDVEGRFLLEESPLTVLDSVAVVITSDSHFSTNSLLEEICLNNDDIEDRFHS